MSKMPVIDLSKTDLAGRDLEIAQACLNKGRLRSTKPKDGEAAYVWRMVAFMISPNRTHQCMPMTADFDMPKEYWGPVPSVRDEAYYEAVSAAAERRRARCKELDKIVDKMVDTVDKNQWHGVHTWGRAFGVL